MKSRHPLTSVPGDVTVWRAALPFGNRSIIRWIWQLYGAGTRTLDDNCKSLKNDEAVAVRACRRRTATEKSASGGEVSVATDGYVLLLLLMMKMMLSTLTDDNVVVSLCYTVL